MMHIANHKEIIASRHEHGMQWHAKQVTQWANEWGTVHVQWVEYHCKGIMNGCMELMLHAASADSSDATDVVVNFCQNDAA